MSVADCYIEVARVVKPQGLRGELKLLLYTGNSDDLARYSSFWLARDGVLMGQFQAERLRATNSTATLKLRGVDDRDAAESFRDCSLFIHEDQLPTPASGQYFIRDLIGLQVISEDGQELGILNDIYELPAHDVYQVLRKEGELLIPAISGVILEVQLDQRIVIVRLPDGLLEAYS